MRSPSYKASYRGKFPRCHAFYRWAKNIFDPVAAGHAARALAWYWRDWRKYSRLPGAENLRFVDSNPQLFDRTDVTPFDAHYYYLSGWAMRRIVQSKAAQHVDVGSLVIFSNLLGAVMPVTFVDYRPLEAKLTGLTSVGGSILDLPFESGTVKSLSCLHVAEHIGLGRYGDPLDPLGTAKAAGELARILAPSGNLFFALPVGHPRVCFNAHRVHSPETVPRYFPGLELVEFSMVNDDGAFVEKAPPATAADCHYACGMYWFTKR